jgi:hypothetical protein
MKFLSHLRVIHALPVAFLYWDFLYVERQYTKNPHQYNKAIARRQYISFPIRKRLTDINRIILRM